MNTMISNHIAAQQFARLVIDDRVRDAEQRRFARAARAERRTEHNPRGPKVSMPPVPWWSLRFLRTAG